MTTQPEIAVLEAFEGGVGHPTEDLAFEAWMLERAAQGTACVSISSWQDPVVVLGYAQNPEQIELEWCRANGVPVLRRLTGGTGVVHHGDLGVALALPAGHLWAKGVVGLYGRFLDALVSALRAVGARVSRKEDPPRASNVRSPICFFDQLSDTLLVDGRKAVGCAQTRRGGAVLIHSAILLGLNASLYAAVFGVEEALIRQGLAPALPGGEWRAIGRIVASHLADALGLELRWMVRPALSPAMLEPYTQPRWAPVPGGENQS
jgi:lipoate-protein ligase A